METNGSMQEDGKAKKMKPNNIFNIPTTLSKDFFKWWCVLLNPFISLTEREKDVVASFLKHRWELTKSIKDPNLLDIVLMSDETKKKVIDDCKITLQHFYVVMSTLRKKGIITPHNTLNPKVIPNMRDDDNGIFQLLILFREK